MAPEIDKQPISVGMRVGYESCAESFGLVVGEINDVEMIDYTQPGPPRNGSTARDMMTRGDVWIILLDEKNRTDPNIESMMTLIWKNDPSLSPIREYEQLVEIEADDIEEIHRSNGVTTIRHKGRVVPTGEAVEIITHVTYKTSRRKTSV